MTSPTEAAVIASKSTLARSALLAGLAAPGKASDDARESLLATDIRQAVISRVDCFASSVAMCTHRSIPSSLPFEKARLVTTAPAGEVMS